MPDILGKYSSFGGAAKLSLKILKFDETGTCLPPNYFISEHYGK